MDKGLGTLFCVLLCCGIAYAVIRALVTGEIPTKSDFVQRPEVGYWVGLATLTVAAVIVIPLMILAIIEIWSH